MNSGGRGPGGLGNIGVRPQCVPRTFWGRSKQKAYYFKSVIL